MTVRMHAKGLVAPSVVEFHSVRLATQSALALIAAISFLASAVAKPMHGKDKPLVDQIRLSAKDCFPPGVYLVKLEVIRDDARNDLTTFQVVQVYVGPDRIKGQAIDSRSYGWRDLLRQAPSFPTPYSAPNSLGIRHRQDGARSRATLRC